MKRIYIPVMFALAFIYTKITLNDFDPGKIYGVSRAPAAAAELLTCKELLVQFYPQQKNSFIKARIKANKDFHSFFRAFPPLFYQRLIEKDFGILLKPLEKYRGTIGGDVHVENFGFIIDDKGKVIFTLNDFDDATEGSIHHDVIRHYVSAKIVDKDMSWSDYFSAYQKGLKGESHTNSFYVEKGIEDVAEVTGKTFKKYISPDAPFKFIDFKEPYRKTTATEITELTKVLKEKFPKVEIFDHYVRIKEDGGSAGLKRFQVLARVEPHEKLQWLDIKESSSSGYDKALGNDEVIFESRLVAIKDNIYGNRFDKSIDTLKIEGHHYSLRFVDQFASGLKLADIPQNDYADVVLDEAYALGKMHKFSLKNNVPAYVKTWMAISGSAIEENLVALKFELRDLYKESKK